jgi:hypothetical protein
MARAFFARRLSKKALKAIKRNQGRGGAVCEVSYLAAHLFSEASHKASQHSPLAAVLARLVIMLTVYSALSHVLTVFEGREHSWITGFYWTLTVMTYLGLRRHHVYERCRACFLDYRAAFRDGLSAHRAAIYIY